MIDKLFYIIYNSYYKHGEYKNDNPSLTVGGIFVGCFFGIGLSIKSIINFTNPLFDPVNNPAAKASKPLMLLVTLICGVLVYFVFYHNKRYQKIYEQFKEDGFLNSKLAKYLAFTTAILIIISPLILALLYNKICRGYWV